MKRKFGSFIGGLLIAGAILSGCSSGVSQEDFDALQSDYAAAIAELESYRQEASESEATPESMIDTISTESETDIQETSADPTTPINIKCDEGSLEYLSYELTNDFDGAPLILIHFNFTNNSSESTTAQMVFYPQVFQNGIQCDMGGTREENDAIRNLSRSIQTGTTLEVAFPYVLQDTENPVDLEIQVMGDLIDGTVYKQTINLQ